jgi:predicted nucleic acid-binding protein
MPIGPAHADTSLVLDNDLLTDWRSRRKYVERYISEYISRLKRPPFLTSMTVFETLHGIEKTAASRSTLDARTDQDRARADELFAHCIVLPFDDAAARIAAYVFPRLSRSNRAKHWADVLVAATAVAHRCGIATRNTRDFELIANHLPPSHQLLRLSIWKR